MLDATLNRAQFLRMSVALLKKKRSAAKLAGKPVVVIAKKEKKVKESRAQLLRRLRTEYTPEVCARTLAIHDSFPIHGEL
jgi:hypothetical protein